MPTSEKKEEENVSLAMIHYQLKDMADKLSGIALRMDERDKERTEYFVWKAQLEMRLNDGAKTMNNLELAIKLEQERCKGELEAIKLKQSESHLDKIYVRREALEKAADKIYIRKDMVKWFILGFGAAGVLGGASGGLVVQGILKLLHP